MLNFLSFFNVQFLYFFQFVSVIMRMRWKATPTTAKPRPLSRLIAAIQNRVGVVMAFSVTLESELLSGERGSPAEMELLKDLPSHDHKNFSRFSQGNWKVSVSVRAPCRSL